MAHMTLQQSWESTTRFSLREAARVVLSDLQGFADRRDHTLRGNQEIAKLYALVGEHGIGKTSWGKTFCLTHTLPMRFLTFGEREAEDNLGIPSTGESRVHHDVLAPPDFPSEEPERGLTGVRDVLPGRDITGGEFPGRGIVWVNEFCSADNKQESQLRSLITERRIGDNLVADGWLLIGDTNPLDPRYQTVNQLDASIESRIYPLCVQMTYEDAMSYWRESNVMPSRMYGFLRMNKPLWDTVDNRRWTTVADTLACLEANDNDLDLCIKILEQFIGPSVGAAYAQYCEHGDNPDFYPLVASDFLNVEGAEYKEMYARVKKWSKNPESQSLLGHTLLDVEEFVLDPGRKLADDQVQRVADILQCGGMSMCARFLEAMGKKLQQRILPMVRGTDFEKRLMALHRSDKNARFGG